MTSMETEYLKGLDGTNSQNRGQGYRGNKVIRRYGNYWNHA